VRRRQDDNHFTYATLSPKSLSSGYADSKTKLMKPLLLFAFTIFLFATASAQTADIAAKSHGARVDESEIIEEADFGLPSDYEERYTRLDSLIYVNDSTVIRVTSVYQTKLRTQPKPVRLSVARDTVYHSPLYSRRHSLDSLKKELWRDGYSEKYIDSTHYVGYDNKAPKAAKPPKQKKKKSIVLIPANFNDPEPPASGAVAIVATALLAALLSVSIAWLYRRMPTLA
jgi:hypothetical protein